MNGVNAVLRVGTAGAEGDLEVQDAAGRQVFRMDGELAVLTIGADGNEGDIRVLDGDGRTVFDMNGDTAFLTVGADGNEGDIRVLDGEGRTVFDMNGNTAYLRVGADGNEGDIEVLDGEGRVVFHMNGVNAFLTVGADGNEGDIEVLDDNGNTTIHLNGGSGDIILENADTAEEFEVVESDVTPGTVMILGPDGRLEISRSAYDRCVAGVISGAGSLRPGIVLGHNRESGRRLPLALNGRVFCKVDATSAPIRAGDLLTTSSLPGHAMKASDPLRAFGAVIGKALQPLETGTGAIPILVALQ
jgi:hypothetical protein